MTFKEFVIPDKPAGMLDPEIAGEGQKIILSDGEQVTWAPPPPTPVMPDWSRIKAIAKYFNRTGYVVYPAWLYHPSEPARLVKNANEAAELGVCYREATIDERGRYGLKNVWDWQEGCLWRPIPYAATAFDPLNPGIGKNYQSSPPSPFAAQNALLEALIPAVAAAVTKSLRGDAPAAPADVDPKQWSEFLEFQAWKKSAETSKEVVEAINDTGAPVNEQGEHTSALTAGMEPDEDDREAWEAEAARKGIKVDKRWGLDRLKREVQEAA